MLTGVRLLGTILCCSACLTSYGQDKFSLLESWEFNWGQIQDLEVVFEETANAVDSDDGGLIHFQKSLLRCNGTHLLSRVERPAQAITWDQSYDFVAQSGMSLHQAPSLARPMGWIKLDDPGAPLLGLEWLCDLLHAPGLDAPQVARYGDYASLAALLLDPRSSLRPEPEIIDGCSALVLDVFDDANPGALWMTVWLDPQRNAVPLQWTLLGGAGEVRFACRLGDYCEYAGAWLPGRIERWLGSGFPNTGLVAVRQICVADGAAQVRVNAGLTPADCSVQFPVGTVVMDDSNGEGYVAARDGALITMDEAFARKAEAASEHAGMASAKSRLAWLGLAAALGFGSVFLARFLTRR